MNRHVAAVASLLLLAAALLGAAEAAIEIGTPGTPSRVPPWDARGLGPLPWQGIACLDMTADGEHIAVGTIAPREMRICFSWMQAARSSASTAPATAGSARSSYRTTAASQPP